MIPLKNPRLLGRGSRITQIGSSEALTFHRPDRVFRQCACRAFAQDAPPTDWYQRVGLQMTPEEAAFIRRDHIVGRGSARVSAQSSAGSETVQSLGKTWSWSGASPYQFRGPSTQSTNRSCLRRPAPKAVPPKAFVESFRSSGSAPAI